MPAARGGRTALPVPPAPAPTAGSTCSKGGVGRIEVVRYAE